MGQTVALVDTASGEVLDERPIEYGAAVARYGRPAPLAFGEVLERLGSPEAIEHQKQLMELYDRAVDALVGPNDVQREGEREFKKKSAWRKIGRFFGVSTEIVHVEKGWAFDEEEGVRHYYAEVHVRGAAPWGQSTVAIGACSTRERRFYRKDGTPNPVARAKAEHDCVATAATRATNRAVSDLVAAGEVSAEEVEGGDHEAYAGSGAPGEPRPTCPECGGDMWDNRPKKRSGAYSEKAPDFRCKRKGCDGKLWPGQWPPRKAEVPEELLEQIGALVEEREIRLDETKASYLAAVLEQARNGELGEADVRAVIEKARGWIERQRAKSPRPAEPPDPVAAMARAAAGAPFGDEDDDLPF